MDPDAEFNLLTTLYQSVVHDMKHTYPGWEAVSQKAQKLGTQLRATAQCMAAFTEAVQTVCDNANNLKGASRDVSACVTRVCIKQRAIENRMRSWADALCEELALSLQQRTAFWKSRCQELDKSASKHVKKVRSRKQRPDVTAMNEQREICTKVLTEQRTQFSFFINTIQPVLLSQISMLDEGSHLRQVVDNLESTVKHVDTEQLVGSIVHDIAQGPDAAWKACLEEAGSKWRSWGSIRDVSTRATTPASNFSTDSSSKIIQNCSKPPLQRRNSEKSIGHYSMSSPNTDGSSSSTYLNLMGSGNGSASSNTITTDMGYHQMAHQNAPPAYQQFISQRNSIPRPQNLAFETYNPSNCIGATPTVYHPSTPATTSSGAGSITSSAFLISEACRDIDQLGSDLENYYLHEVNGSSTTPLDKRSSMSNYGVLSHPQMVQNGNQTVRIRTTSASRPPPPARRSSQITAATPTAPSVAEQRMNGSMAGSRQSLDSAGLFDSAHSQQYYQMTSFARPQPPNSAATAAAAKFRI